MKQPLTNEAKKFNLKFLLVGDSGVGKTHFCGSYTKGPIHFYMTDPGGEKTLLKLLENRPAHSPITLDQFSHRKTNFTAFWKQLQKDEREGLFDELAAKQGLVVLPDSLTTLNDMILSEVARTNGRTLTSDTKPMRIQDWGILIQYMKELIGVVNDLPCAVASTAHILVNYDKDGSISSRYPAVNGRFASSMGVMFDEVYLLEPFGNKRRIYFTENRSFQAKSRVFSCSKLEDITLDFLAEAYLKGDTLANNQTK